jgi:hypothetical protein
MAEELTMDPALSMAEFGLKSSLAWLSLFIAGEGKRKRC